MRDLLCLHLSAVIPSYCDFTFLTKVLFLSICLANFPGSYSSHHSFFLPVLSVSHHTFHIHSKFCSYIILSYLFILYSLFSIHQLFWILALATALSCKKIEHSILEHLPLPRTCLHLYWSSNLVGPVTPRNNFHLFFSYLAEDKSSQNLYAISSELFKSIIMISLLGLTFTVTIVNFFFFLLL